ncbi:MAG TPA: baseplate J/gp47 family protein, partial [Devosia sp.]|nr:baseplate J/gp47 family protein [Devosia sp.]
TEFIARLKAAFDAVGIDYDVDLLATDPGVILMEVAAYIDVNLRQRINEAIRANLLAFAYGGDLDHLAQFYDVSRQMGEGDERLRERVVLAIRGRSTGGTEPRYQAIAMAADVRIADVSVYTVGRDPTVRVAIFSSDNNGVASQSLVDKVSAALNDPAVRMVNDLIVVAPAVRQVVNISAQVWLLPQAPISTVSVIEAALRSAWADQIVMGRDVTRSWVVSRLMLGDVQRVEIDSPASDIAVPADQAAALGAVNLTVAGRDF